jgi:large subunit ribosomal protein L18
MITKIDRKAEKQRRHIRVRRKVVGTSARPRLSVFRSNTQIYVQIIDDSVPAKSVTLVSTSSLVLKLENGNNIEGAKAVGAEIGKLALEKGITDVVFDRGGSNYHGRVKALAEAAREAGLKF